MQSVWKEYQEKNKDRFLQEMLELLRIPSISAKSEHREDMRRCAGAVRQRLLEAGAGRAEVMPTAGHPVVYAEKIVDPAKPTVLVYGHYDVQPPEPLELWTNPPFEPTIRDGKIYARGSADDRSRHLRDLSRTHAVVLGGLALSFASGVLLFLSDVDEFLAAPAFWVKLVLISLLLLNGFMMTRTEKSLASGGDETTLWARLRTIAVLSQFLWITTTLVGVVLMSYA